MSLFRRLQFGDVADLHLLDTRQYRADEPEGDHFGSADPDSLALEGVLGEALFDADGILDPKATLLGAQQEGWLVRNLAQSRAPWNILAQQVVVMHWDLIESGRASVALVPNIPAELKAQLLPPFDQDDDLYNLNAWDGYQAAHQRLIGIWERIYPSNPVILTGDIRPGDRRGRGALPSGAAGRLRLLLLPAHHDPGLGGALRNALGMLKPGGTSGWLTSTSRSRRPIGVSPVPARSHTGSGRDGLATMGSIRAQPISAPSDV